MRERKGKKLRIDTGSVCVWDSIDLLVYIFLQFLFCIFMQIVRPFVLMQRDMECVCWMIMGLATDIWEVLICRRPTHSLKQTRFVLGDFFFFLLSFKGKFFFFSPFFMWCWRETNGEIEEMYAIVVGMWNAAATTHTHIFQLRTHNESESNLFRLTLAVKWNYLQAWTPFAKHHSRKWKEEIVQHFHTHTYNTEYTCSIRENTTHTQPTAIQY